MSSIRDTVAASLRQAGLASYERQAEPVIVALVEREADLSKSLLDFATENGLTSDQARGLLEGLDMEVPSDDESDDRIAAMEAQITAMQETLRSMRR